MTNYLTITIDGNNTETINIFNRVVPDLVGAITGSTDYSPETHTIKITNTSDSIVSRPSIYFKQTNKSGEYIPITTVIKWIKIKFLENWILLGSPDPTNLEDPLSFYGLKKRPVYVAAGIGNLDADTQLQIGESFSFDLKIDIPLSVNEGEIDIKEFDEIEKDKSQFSICVRHGVIKL